jgi:predicted metal-dependent hydrolase
MKLIKRTFDWVKRRLPLKVRLGMTAFMEHCTATAAHAALGEHSDLPYQHPTMAELWRWHAVEEIEHKAVAYDLFRKMGGGYLLRVFSALLVIGIDAALFRKLIRNFREDVREGRVNLPRDGLTEEQRAFRSEAKRTLRRSNRQMRDMALAYFKPGFHPWQIDDSPMLQPVYARYGKDAQEAAE